MDELSGAIVKIIEKLIGNPVNGDLKKYWIGITETPLELPEEFLTGYFSKEKHIIAATS
jgi:hypothetical protein